MKFTKSIKPNEVKRDWIVIDAEGKKFGRLISEVASLLRGKHKPIFTIFPLFVEFRSFFNLIFNLIIKKVKLK